MILSFKKQFKEPILNGTKIHTIREDKPKRWKAGNNIHAATGVRTKQFNCFFTGKCISTQKIEIRHFKDHVSLFLYSYGNEESEDLSTNSIKEFCRYNKVRGRYEMGWTQSDLIERIAKNDGFKDLESFFKWFDRDFEGIIIHWTDLTY